MSKKDIFIIILKVIMYLVGLLLAYFGVESLTSCTTSHTIDAVGRTVITTHDTTFVDHKGYIYFPKR